MGYAATKWNHADDVETDDMKEYLVITNARDWGDADYVKVMRGAFVRHLMRPEMIRGRPVWVAEIVMPKIGEPLR